MNEDKATRYHRLRRRAILAAAGWQALLLVALLLTGLATGLSRAAWALTAGVPAVLRLPLTACVWVTVVALASEFGGLPLSFYAGSTLERRYGLSRQSPAAWIGDHLKANVLRLGYTWLAAVWVSVSLERWPSVWWLVAWAGAVAAAIVAAWAAPVMLLPLFYRLTPLKDAGLRQRLLTLAERAEVPAVGIFEWRLGDRSSRANAALAGIGATRRIIVSDTLVADYQPAEIEAVVAHELAHHARHDIWRSLAVDAIVAGLALAASDRVLRATAAPLRLAGMADVAGLGVVALAALAVGWLASPIVNAVSRVHERRADRFALDLTRDAGAFVSAMRRLGAGNLVEDTPTLVARTFFHTHPPLSDRLASARAWAAGVGSGRSTGGGA
jgi:STE24 endopeptidase